MIVTLDTNVLYQMLHSRRGASFAIFELIRAKQIAIALSVPTFLEYEDVLLRPTSLTAFGFIEQDVLDFLEYFDMVGERFTISYLWRPNLRDEADNMFVELAVTSQSTFLVTNNVRDFRVNANLHFDDVLIVTPNQFMSFWRANYE